MEAYPLVLIHLTKLNSSIGFRKCRTKGLYAIYCGQTLMIGWDGVYRQEVLVIHLVRILVNNLIKPMALNL